MIKQKDALDIYNKMYGTDYKNINELGVVLARIALKNLYLATKALDQRKIDEKEELEV